MVSQQNCAFRLDTPPVLAPSFRFRGEATALIVRHLVGELADHLTLAALPATEISSVQIVVAEVLNNITEHAYPDQHPGSFNLHVRVTRDQIVAVVSDHGERVPDCVLFSHPLADPGGDAADLPEGGFGWSLIHVLSARIRHRYVDGQNWLAIAISRSA